VFLAGLLSFGTASANPAPLATASGVGFLDCARGIAPADGRAERPTSAGEILSLLGMPLEGVNPPAHAPATDFASSGDRPARPGKDVPRQAGSPTDHGKLGSGVPPSVASVDGCPPEIPSADAALEQADPAAVVRLAGGMPVRPAAESPAKAAGSGSPDRAPLPQTNPETVPPAGTEAGDAPARTGPFPEAAFALGVGRRERIEACPPPQRPRGALNTGICSRLGVDATLGRPGAIRRVAALVGSPGAGKTTAWTKLAAASGLAERRPARVLSMDAAGIAAAGQPRALAGILGIGFQALATTGALSPALQEHRNQELIPIDTPGFSPRDLDMGLDPALFLLRLRSGTHICSWRRP